MSEYVKKPVVIEAIEYNGENGNEIAEFMKCMYPAYDENKNILIGTLEGVMSASKGDFIIKGVKGEFYPCKPDIFEKTYLAYQPKRKPLSDGSLELTSEELCKFNQLMELTEIKKVFVKNGFIYYTFFDLDIILRKRSGMCICSQKRILTKLRTRGRAMESRELKWMKCTKCGMSLCESETAKRKPLPDGTLLLTESELEEFSKINGFTVKDVQYDGTYIHLNKRDYMGLCYVKAILYLATLFDLEVK